MERNTVAGGELPVGLLVQNRSDRALLLEGLQELQLPVRLLEDRGEPTGWEGLSLLILDEGSVPRHLGRLAELKARAAPLFLPALVAVPRMGSGDRWLREGLDDILRLPIPRQELKARLLVHLGLRARTAETERQIFQEVPVGLFRATPAGEILAANPALARMLCFPSSEALLGAGPVLAQVRTGAGTPSLPELVAGGAAVQGLDLLWRGEGCTRWLRWSARARRNSAGEVVALEGSVDDVTEWHAVQRELSRAREELRHAQKMEAVGRLAGGIAHDFNNLLTALRGNAAIVLEALPPEHALREEVEEMDAVARRASTLTRQLLVLSRRQVARVESVELNAVVEETLRLLTRLIGADVELDARLERSGVQVLGDAGNLQQVVLNLALNARDAMPEGGRLSLATGRFQLSDRERARSLGLPEGEYGFLEVADTGTGIAPEALERIFEPFFTTKETGKGTGLGLSIVEGIVRQAGGTLEVESAPGAGSTFRVLLPLQAHSAPSTVEGTPDEPPRGRGELILLVEDDAAVRRPTQRILERLGYRVSTAEDGVEALEFLEEKGETVDLLLSDVVMPRMTGPALYRALEGRFPGLGVLFVSGYTQEESGFFQDDGSGGVPPLLEKPFDTATLARYVRAALDDTGSRGGSDPSRGEGSGREEEEDAGAAAPAAEEAGPGSRMGR